MNLFFFVLTFMAVQLTAVSLYAFILSRYIHRLPFLVWLNTRLGPPSIPEMVVTLACFLLGTGGAFWLALLGVSLGGTSP